VKLKITELSWVMLNWDKLTPEEQARLEALDLPIIPVKHRQYQAGEELHHSMSSMATFIGTVLGIYDKYHREDDLTVMEGDTDAT
jgi:hypothetical protein